MSFIASIPGFSKADGQIIALFVPSFLSRMAIRFMRDEQATIISFEEHMLNLVTDVSRRPLLDAEFCKYIIFK